MKKTILVLFLCYCSISSFAQFNNPIYKRSQNSEVIDSYISIITPILIGEEYSIIRDRISKEAFIIMNNSYESLFDVLLDPSKKENFILGKDLKIRFLRLFVREENKNAFMILETNKGNQTNWHSILFVMNENNDWQILSWHRN